MLKFLTIVCLVFMMGCDPFPSPNIQKKPILDTVVVNVYSPVQIYVRLSDTGASSHQESGRQIVEFYDSLGLFNDEDTLIITKKH